MKNLKTFKLFLEESVRNVVVTIGHFDPPALDLLSLMDSTATIAKRQGAHYKIFSYQTESNRHPLSYELKVKWLRKLFPTHARSIILNKSIDSCRDVAVSLYNDGYRDVTFVGCSVTNQKVLMKYNGIKGEHGYYMFPRGFTFVPGEESFAEWMLDAVKVGNFDLFKTGISNPKYADDLYRDLRSAMGIKESTRELYVRGEIFNEGTKVKYNGETATIVSRGPNYLKLKLTNETTKKVWLTEVEQL